MWRDVLMWRDIVSVACTHLYLLFIAYRNVLTLRRTQRVLFMLRQILTKSVKRIPLFFRVLKVFLAAAQKRSDHPSHQHHKQIA